MKCGTDDGTKDVSRATVRQVRWFDPRARQWSSVPLIVNGRILRDRIAHAAILISEHVPCCIVRFLHLQGKGPAAIPWSSGQRGESVIILGGEDFDCDPRPARFNMIWRKMKATFSGSGQEGQGDAVRRGGKRSTTMESGGRPNNEQHRKSPEVTDEKLSTPNYGTKGGDQDEKQARQADAQEAPPCVPPSANTDVSKYLRHIEEPKTKIARIETASAENANRGAQSLEQLKNRLESSERRRQRVELEFGKAMAECEIIAGQYRSSGVY